MKGMLLAVLSTLWLSAVAQITITNVYFPVVGDTLRYTTLANAATMLELITPPDENQQWDYSHLKSNQNTVIAYLAPSAGNNAASFPGADLLVKTFGGGESYYNITNTQFEFMGFSGGAAIPLVPTAVGRYSPALIERRAPLNYRNTHGQTSNLTIPFAVSDLPPIFDSILASIPLQFDSVRVRVRFQNADTVDAWGQLKIPNATEYYPVLRQKRITKTRNAVEARIAGPFPLWVDITAFLGGTPFGGFTGADSFVVYRFLSNDHKEELLTVTANFFEDTIRTVRYKTLPLSVSVTPLLDDAPGTASVQALPNPAVDKVRFECNNLPSDEYTLKIFNLVGKVVWRETFQASGRRIVHLDLDDFNKGTYLYSLSNKKGEIIGTKRLIVVKP
jgi:hypothetical protein